MIKRRIVVVERVFRGKGKEGFEAFLFCCTVSGRGEGASGGGVRGTAGGRDGTRNQQEEPIYRGGEVSSSLL